MTARKDWIGRIVVGVMLAALAAWPARSRAGEERRIAITFDDVPWVMSRNVPPADMAAKHARLIASLKQAGVPAIGFVNEGLLYADNTLRPERVRMLEDWLDAGFALGNHTRWHSDLNAVGVRRFQQDILEGERLLRPMLAKRGAKPEWFRYPLLRTGTTLEDKAAVETFLAQHGYRVAPVTVNSSEWVFALAYRRAHASKSHQASLQKLRDEYIGYMQAKLAYYEQRSVDLLGYEVPQVIVLHANELNADTCAALVAAIRARGYRFVTLAEATSDVAYRRTDAYTGAMGTSWIHRWAKTAGRPDTFHFGEPRTPKWIIELAGVSPSFE